LATLLSILILAASGAPKVAVHELSGAVDAQTRGAFTAQLRSALHRAGVYTLIAAEESSAIDAALAEQLAQGCEDDCLEALGRALHADLLLRGSIARVGGISTIDLKLIDLGSRRTLRSGSRRVDGALEDLLPLIEALAAELSGLERMPIKEVDGLAILPLQADDLAAARRAELAAASLTTADRSGRFRALYAGKRLEQRLKKGLLRQAKACAEAACVASIGAAVRLPFASQARVERLGEQLQISVMIVESATGKRRALETMIAPDAHSLTAALRAVMSSAITRTFDPEAPQLHRVMKVSVIAGADPKLRAKRRRYLRFGGLGMIGAGAAIGGLGWSQTNTAATALRRGHDEPQSFASDWQAAKAGLTVQWAGVGVAAGGAALLGWSLLQ
jgi:hypothetical protein